MRTSAPVQSASSVRTLAALVGLAVLLRVPLLGKSLWLDEGIAIGNAWAGGLPLTQWSSWLADLWSRSEFNMVFYFAALRLWLRAGSSEAFIRLLSVFPAVATLPIVYLIGKRLFDSRIALAATLLLAVHGSHVTYSQEARGYTMVVFFCAASTYFFIRAIQEGGWKFWALYTAMAALGTYTHLFGLLVVASHWTSLLALSRRGVPWLKLLVCSLLLVGFVGPVLYFAASNHGHQVEWIPTFRPSQVVNALSELAGGPATLVPYVLLWAGGTKYCLRLWRTHTRTPWPATLILSWALVPLLIGITVSIRKPMLVPRYFLISAPASVLLAAIGADEFGRRSRQVVLWAAVVLSVGFVVFRYTRPKENWRDASTYVLSRARKEDAVVVVPSWSQPVFEYYRRREGDQGFREILSSALKDEPSFIDEASRNRRIWVVSYTRNYALNEPDTRAVDATIRKFHLVEGKSFRMLQVSLYATAPTPQSSER